MPEKIAPNKDKHNCMEIYLKNKTSANILSKCPGNLKEA